jgi:hypothetical protein
MIYPAVHVYTLALASSPVAKTSNLLIHPRFFSCVGLFAATTAVDSASMTYLTEYVRDYKLGDFLQKNPIYVGFVNTTIDLVAVAASTLIAYPPEILWRRMLTYGHDLRLRDCLIKSSARNPFSGSLFVGYTAATFRNYVGVKVLDWFKRREDEMISKGQF